MKMVMDLSDFATYVARMMRRYVGKPATDEVQAEAEARIKTELAKHCVVDDNRYRVTDVSVEIDTTEAGDRLAVEWIS